MDVVSWCFWWFWLSWLPGVAASHTQSGTGGGQQASAAVTRMPSSPPGAPASLLIPGLQQPPVGPLHVVLYPQLWAGPACSADRDTRCLLTVLLESLIRLHVKCNDIGSSFVKHRVSVCGEKCWYWDARVGHVQ